MQGNPYGEPSGQMTAKVTKGKQNVILLSLRGTEKINNKETWLRSLNLLHLSMILSKTKQDNKLNRWTSQSYESN